MTRAISATTKNAMLVSKMYTDDHMIMGRNREIDMTSAERQERACFASISKHAAQIYISSAVADQDFTCDIGSLRSLRRLQ